MDRPKRGAIFQPEFGLSGIQVVGHVAADVREMTQEELAQRVGATRQTIIALRPENTLHPWP